MYADVLIDFHIIFPFAPWASPALVDLQEELPEKVLQARGGHRQGNVLSEGGLSERFAMTCWCAFFEDVGSKASRFRVTD